MPLPSSRPIPMRAAAFASKAAWLHDPGVPGVRAGIVIAGSIGFETLTTHRFLRLLADRLAASGWPVLRFDWPGSGDSAGEIDVAGWPGDLDEAVDHLKAETGVDTVLVVGLRIAALIAAEVAARRDDVGGLVLLAPPASGRLYGRELAGLSRLIDGALPSPADAAAFDGLTAAGFAFPRAALDEIARLAWPRAVSRTAPLHPLVLTAGGAPALSWLPEALGTATVEPFAGYAEMMCDPTAGEVAEAALDRVVAWIGAPPVSEAKLPAHEPPIRDRTLFGDGWVEEAVTFGPGDRLAGIWCRPTAKRPGAAVLFTNAGGIPHGGWARMTVDHARLIARHGVASLRMDFAEMGDSADVATGPRVNLYGPELGDDIGAALDWIAARGIGSVTLTGTCSGAHHSFHVAARDARVSGLVLVNILCFEWGPSYALGLNVWKHAKTRLAGATDAGSGRPTLAGRLIGRIKKPATRAIRTTIALMQSDPGRRLWARLTGRRPMTRVEATIRALHRRGVAIAFVSVTSDGSLAEIARHLGPMAEAVSDLGIPVHLIANSDHTLTPPHARAALGRHLLAFLGVASAPGRTDTRAA